MKKYIFTKIIIFMLVVNAYSQSVSITPEHTSGSCSDYIVFFDGVTSSVATSFNFDGGNLPAGWSTSPFTISATTCTGQNSPDNSPYFWATTLHSGGTYDGKRFVQTNAVNVSGGGNISFYIRYGNNEGTGCEQPDEADEEVVLYYSTDGGSTWTVIYDGWNTTSTGSFAWYNWYLNNFAIPAGAQTTSTIFRWYQPSNSGSGYDNWGLEDVTIGSNISPSSYQWFVNGSPVGTSEDLTYTFPSAGTYSVNLQVLFSDGITRTSTISYEVLSNQNPTLDAISNIIIPMNSGQQTINLSGITDGDCVAQGLSLSAASGNTSVIPTPAFSYTSPNTTGSLYFTPVADEVGTVQLSATVTDDGSNSYGSGLSILRNFEVYVNDYPTDPGAFTQPINDKLNIDYDYDIEWGASTDQTAGVTYYLEYSRNSGAWTPITSGASSTSYSNWGGHKNISYVGQNVQFRVRAYDGTYYSGYTYSSTYEITENEPPVANDDSYKRFYTDSQKPFTFDASIGVLANDTDPDSDPITAVLNTGVSHGALTLNADGSFTYTPNDGYKDLNDSFTYYANDGQVNSVSPATVTIEILTPRFTNANGTGLFSDPLNWNCGYVPDIESLDIIIDAGQNMVVDQNYTCKNLQFEMGSSFNCTNGSVLTITEGVLDASGKVAIDVASSLEVRSSIEIPQSLAIPGPPPEAN